MFTIFIPRICLRLNNRMRPKQAKTMRRYSNQYGTENCDVRCFHKATKAELIWETMVLRKINTPINAIIDASEPVSIMICAQVCSHHLMKLFSLIVCEIDCGVYEKCNNLSQSVSFLLSKSITYFHASEQQRNA